MSNTPKPTPGKWTQSAIRGGLIYASRYPYDAIFVADCNHSKTDDDGQHANAAFIVTAYNNCADVNPTDPQAVAKAIPDLYRALHDLVGMQDGEDFSAKDCYREARAALAKAEGREP